MWIFLVGGSVAESENSEITFDYHNSVGDSGKRNAFNGFRGSYYLVFH